jgi:ABC-type polysaccharide transport system permease subunit
MHPFAAGCPTCGADLDAARRQQAPSRSRSRVALPAVQRDLVDLLVPAIVLLLLALFAPLFGALIALFVVWHSHHNSLTARRNVAIACAALAIFNLFAPDVLRPALTF